MNQWPDGTTKSIGSAFDWKNPASVGDLPKKPVKPKVRAGARTGIGRKIHLGKHRS